MSPVLSGKPENSVVSESLAAALDFARRGWPVLPVCWPDDTGECACPGETGANGAMVPHTGKDIGKAPVGALAPHAAKSATTDAATLSRWWARFPRANVGIDLERAGLLMVDPDSDAARADAIERGLPPSTIRQSRNPAYLYARPADCPATRVSRTGASQALDVLTAGYAVVHGRHKTGADVFVEWISEPAPAPSWAVEVIRQEAARRAERQQRWAERPTGDGANREPPVRLAGFDLERWNGTRLERTETGAEDRSKSLFMLGRVLFDAGATRETIVAALGERDATLGWRKYRDRVDGGAENYAGIVDELERTGPTPRLRITDKTGEPFVWPEPARVLGLPAAPKLDLALFPPELANVALDAAERLDCPADYLMWPLVASLGGLAGRGVVIRPRQRDDWGERPCFWVANIGDPSTAKTPAQLAGTQPLRYVAVSDHQQYAAEKEAWEVACETECKKGKHTRDCREGEPVEERRFTSDATIEKLADLMATARGLTLVRDELAGWIGNLNKYSKASDGDRQFFLECYSGGAYTVDRIKRGTVRVEDLYLNVIGGVQPDKARHVFGEGDDDGFAARFIAAYPDAPSTAREVDRWPDSSARAALTRVSERLASAPWAELLTHDQYDDDAPPFCRPDPEAGRLWSEWSTALRGQLRQGSWDGRLRGRVGKYPGLAARLALLWHLLDWSADRVSDAELRSVPAETLAGVLNVMDGYISPMDSRVYRAFDRSDAANGGERIARWIVETRRSAPFTVRDIRRHEWSGLADNEPILAALEWLAAQGWVREADPEQRPGRPTNRYEVNPRVWEVLSDAA